MSVDQRVKLEYNDITIDNQATSLDCYSYVKTNPKQYCPISQGVMLA